ncbi:hypothetical protein FAIPA1_120055 [Frankia sp. AiPs1]
MPEPVGATTRVSPPPRMASHAPRCAGVGAAKAAWNHSRVGAENGASGSAAVSSPAVSSPTVSSPTVSSMAVSSPAVSSPAVSSPTVSSPTVSSPTVSSPTVSSMAVSSPALSSCMPSSVRRGSDSFRLPYSPRPGQNAGLVRLWEAMSVPEAGAHWTDAADRVLGEDEQAVRFLLRGVVRP